MVGIVDSQSCKQIPTQASLGLEYLRLSGIPTLVWIASSSLLVALQRYRAEDLSQLSYSMALVFLAMAFGGLLAYRNRLSVATCLGSDCVLLTLTSCLWVGVPPSSNLLQLMTYALLLYGVFATLIGVSSFGVLKSNAQESASTEIVANSSSNKFSWKWIGVVLVAGLIFYMVIAPAISMAIDYFTPKRSTLELTDMSFMEHLRLQSVSGIVMLLFLATGASIGSFLNVAIYRLPRRRTLLWPPSACPNCGYKIKGMDNTPILAWIGLRGRCRQCSVSISSRYPVIEATVAAVFVIFFYVLLLSGGQNLPVRQPNIYRGIVWIILYTKWDLVTIYFFHMGIFSVLLVWAMINWDRFRVPRVSAICSIVLTTILVALFPHLNPLTSRQSSIEPLIPSGLWVSLLGASVGGIAGMLLQYLFANRSSIVARTPSVTEPPHEPHELTNLPSVDDAVVSSAQVFTKEDPLVAVASSLGTNVESSQSENSTLQNADLTNQSVENPAVDGAVSQTSEPVDLYGAMSKQPTSTTDASLSLALFGAAFGPQAALSIMLFAIVIQASVKVFQKLRGKELRVPVTMTLFAIAILHTAVWRQSSYLSVAWWPTPEADLLTTFIWVAITALGLLVLASRSIVRRSAAA